MVVTLISLVLEFMLYLLEVVEVVDSQEIETLLMVDLEAEVAGILVLRVLVHQVKDMMEQHVWIAQQDHTHQPVVVEQV